MTNFEKIKSMSVEEMAYFINENDRACAMCFYENVYCARKEFKCEVGIKMWLESEVKEDGTL